MQHDVKYRISRLFSQRKSRVVNLKKITIQFFVVPKTLITVDTLLMTSLNSY